MRLLGFCFLLVFSGSLSAQNAKMDSALAVHRAEFDYLLGDWQFTAVSKEYGAFHGYWSAVKLGEGQILDEYRVVGDTGQTWYVTTTLRNYNGAADRWELISSHPGDGLLDFGTGKKVGDEMRIEQTFSVAAGQPSTWRIRYHHIQADRFSWAADRSTDNGRTFVADFQTIEARRIGAARTMPALAPARNKRP
jgi:hypothetical protein